MTIDWTFVGDAGNACDPQPDGCFGALDYELFIGTYEVTNAQYAEFLDAVAANDDPNALWNPSMAAAPGGISRSGSQGSFAYTELPGREDLPVVFVSFYDALRFVNWLHNGQPVGDQDATTTEDGAYTFSDSTTVGPLNAGAQFHLPNEDEWYKAAYYDPGADLYYAFPTGTSSKTSCTTPTSAPNSANCDFAVDDLTPIGAYAGSPGPFGSFDQGGNAFEWTESPADAGFRVVRGGGFNNFVGFLRASSEDWASPRGEADSLGFRVAKLPEPGPLAGLAAGALALLALRRRR